MIKKSDYILSHTLDVNKTNKYEIFKLVTGNRKIRHDKKLSKSIALYNALGIFPILCYREKGYFWVVDGQGRLKAAQIRGEFIYFIEIPKPADVQFFIRVINSYNTVWTITDSISQGVKNKIPAYIDLVSWFKKYKGMDKRFIVELYDSTFEDVKLGLFSYIPLDTITQSKLNVVNDIALAVIEAYRTNPNTNKRSGNKEQMNTAIWQTLDVIKWSLKDLPALITSAKLAATSSQPIINDDFAAELRSRL